MRKTMVVLLVGAVVGMGVFHVFAQGPSPEWKAKNSIGERYEGIGFDPDVSAGFQLIALMALSDSDPRNAIDASRDDEIVVDFHSRLASPYTLVARELDRSKYYWMEPKVARAATIGHNTFTGIWKTDRLRELKKSERTAVPVSGLGVLVWFFKGDDGIEQVAPAVMRAPTAKPLQKITAYRATFLPDMLIDDVSYSVRGGCQASEASKLFPGGGSVGKQFPGSSFYVDVSIPTGYSGQVLLEIVTPRLDGTTGDKKTWYCFMHPPASR